MNLLLFESDEVTNDNIVYLQDRRSEHIIKILGCRPGDRIRAGIINGPAGTGEILAITGKGKNSQVTLRFTPHGFLHIKPNVDLILGLVRPIMLKRLLAQITSMGIGRIFLINANRVEKSFFAATLLKDENYRPYLVQGLEQSKDTSLPLVSIHERFKPFLEDFVPTIADSYSKMLVADPGADIKMQHLGDFEYGGRVLLAVGPEGGWVDFEIEKFVEQFFVPVSLGKRILRTDTAVVALLSQLMVLTAE